MYTVVERVFHFVLGYLSSHLMVSLTNKTMVTKLTSYMDWLYTVHYFIILLDKNGLQNYHNVVLQYHVI